jgi:glycosyltransferase involved in cell wall biosynthesis
LDEDEKYHSIFSSPKNQDRTFEGGLRTQGKYKKSSTNLPLVSIITVVFNGELHLEQAIFSVLEQTYSNVEYIIIDGGSNDDTLKIIKKHIHSIDYSVSEKDSGIYDAMNKGIHLASGDIIGLLNCDDWLYPNALAETVTLLTGKNDSYTYGKVTVTNEQGKPIGELHPLPSKNFDKRIYKEMPCPHLSVFIKRVAYKKLGLFNLSYSLSADYDLLLRLHRNNFKGVENCNSVGAFRMGGKSGGVETFRQSRLIAMAHGLSSHKANIGYCISVVKIYAVKIIPKFLYRFVKKFTNSKMKPLT